jgi:hypothetical protein
MPLTMRWNQKNWDNQLSLGWPGICAYDKKMKSNIAIQPRDLEFLQLLLHTRILTLRHAAALVFNGSGEAAKKRIQKLKSAGLVLEKRRKAYEPGILFLSQKGFECLRRENALPELCNNEFVFAKRKDVSELTLRHELAVLDIKTVFHQAAENEKNLSLAEFATWPWLYEFFINDTREGQKTVKPDGYIRLHEQDADGEQWEHLFFLEMDRGTEKLETLVQKAVRYNQFYREGGMATRHNQPKEAYQDFPFRVLFVVKSEQRKNNLATMLLQATTPITTQAWIAIFEDVIKQPFAPIWLEPRALQQTGAGCPTPAKSLIG